MALVLCTGSDPSLIETRKMILEQAGHNVITAVNGTQLTNACEKYRFDVVVIGQTLIPTLKRAVASLIRQQCPAARILELYPPYQGRTIEDADSWLIVPAEVPQDLAKRVDELARGLK